MGNDGRMPLHDADFVLLSQIHKEKQALIRNDAIIYLSTEDALPIGEGSEFGANHKEVYLYAEHITVSGTFKLTEGIVSANRISTIGEAAFDLRGEPGLTPLAGVDGTDGEDGGDFSLYVAAVEPDAPKFTINTSGGKGGNGKAGTASANGGNGGNGGDGGDVKLIYGHPYLKLLAELKSIYQIDEAEEKAAAVVNLLARYPEIPQLEPLRQAAEEHQVEPATINAAIQQIAPPLSALADAWKSRAIACTNTSGGLYGTYGEGTVNGKNGYSGERGQLYILPFGSEAALSGMEEKLFFPWIHPVQCQMLFEKARLRYLCLEASDREAVAETVVYFKRLQQKTSPFEQVEAGSSLDKLWSKYERRIAAVGSVGIFKDLYDKSVLYLDRLSKGLDYYGYPYNYAPVVSFEFSRGQLDTLVANFKTIQREYMMQMEALQDVTRAKSALAAARSQAEFTFRSHTAKINKLMTMLRDTERIIDRYTPHIALKKAIVEEKIERFKQDLERYFDWNWDNIFSSLGSIAFVPTSSVMWITQGAKVAFDGKTKITGSGGDSINEAYLVNRLKTISKDFHSLKEGYESLPDGMLQPDDPGAAKLIGDAEAIESILDQVSGKIDDAELRAALNDYVQTVIDRNGHIMTYNAIASLMLQTMNERQELKAAIDRFNQQMIDMMTEVSPEYTAFVGRMYFDAIAQIFEMLHLTARSYNFWALKHEQLSDLLGGNVKEITYAGLLSAQNKIVGLYEDAVKNFGTNCSVFPAGKQRGIEYKLTPLQVALMKSNYETMVRIPIAKQGSDEVNPFAGLANVRITKVRCYLHGAKAKPNGHIDEILLHITHTGQEQIVSLDREVYTFQHDKRKVPFKYDLKRSTIRIDGDFKALPGEKEVYALYGPYTTWKIEVEPEYRAFIDLSEVTAITLEFHGTCYSQS